MSLDRGDRETPPLCPLCDDNLYFRRTSSGTLFVYCQDCSAVWVKPSATKWEDEASRDTLQDHFARAGDTRPLEAIFDSCTWATRAQVQEDTLWAPALDVVACLYHD